MTPRRLRLFGAGIRAQIVADLVRWELSDTWLLEGVYDDALAAGTVFYGSVPVLGDINSGLSAAEADRECAFFIAFGTHHRLAACKLLNQLVNQGATLASIVAKSASISPTARIGVSTVVLPMTFLGCQVVVGDLCVIHGGAIVEHHSQLGSDVLLGPGVSIASSVRISDHCFLGAGVCVAPSVEIGVGTLVGTGAAVIASQPAHSIIHGVPAKVQRQSVLGDEVLTEAEYASLGLQLRANSSVWGNTE